MKIVAGAKSYAEAGWLFASGAAEVYCALSDIPNHRRDSLSVRSEAELLRIAALAREKRASCCCWSTSPATRASTRRWRGA